MIKFIATNERTGRRLLGFGLSEGNLQRLRNDEPIHVDVSKMHEDLDVDLMIFYGKTEQEMADMLKEHGLVTPETLIHVDPTLENPHQ